MAIAILRFNEPDTYISILKEALGLFSGLISFGSILKTGRKLIEHRKIKNKRNQNKENINRCIQRKKQITSDNSKASGYDFSHRKS